MARSPHVFIAFSLVLCLTFIYTHDSFHNTSQSVSSYSQPQYKSKQAVQLEPEPQIGSDIDPDHCSPRTLPIETPSEPPSDIIPNIVHYVWLNALDGFSVDFRYFISIYSASYYFQPEAIYIHTDASPERWEEAKRSGNDATRWTLSIPNVRHHWVKPPKYTLNCLEIKRIEHVSDFVRTQQLYNYGGIYLDADAVPLRDVRKLRESGFANIVGNEDVERINNGVMISKPRNALLGILMREQHIAFDNEWLTHSVELLTTVASRLQAVPGEVMVLGVKAFAPSSWVVEAVEALFNPHTDMVVSAPGVADESSKVQNSFEDTVAYWQRRNSTVKAEWENDYSSTYVLHAFKGISDPYWPKRVDLEYVIARQSNFARAVYPAIKHALDVGIINRKPKMKNDSD